jgi:signal transduction histidine kinase
MLLALLGLGCLLGYLLARLISRRLSRPLLELDVMAERVASGERGVALENGSRDEIGHLTRTFNRMAAALGEREDELNRLNRQLESKVAERTELLEQQSLKLIRAQEELRQSEKLAAIGSLAAGVAHEINNPAAIIRGNVELLQMTLDPEDSRREEVDEILKNTERIALITQDLLTFAREQAIHSEQVQINDLLREILGQIGHQAPLGAVEVECRFDPDLLPLAADGQGLRQVFTNLLLNALQALAGAGRLTLTTRRCGDRVEILVQDSGPGIPPEIREKIFNPFFTTRRAGTGLGLSISYGIVQALNGRIEVESRVGEGTTFLVRLPLAPSLSD